MATYAGNGLTPEVASFAQKHGLTLMAQDELQKLLNASVSLAQRRVTVSVPATVANLGPGLEVVGMAVDIWDEFTLEFADHFSVEIRGLDTPEVPRNEENLVVQGAASAFKEACRPFPTMHFICEHRIPYDKGLGAASAAFVGGFLAGSVLCAEELRHLERSTELRHLEKSTEKSTGRSNSKEGFDVVDCSAPTNASGVETLLEAAIARGWNPGNVCPAIYGAIQIGINTSNGMRSHRVPCPHGLVLCLFVPDGQEEETGLDMELVDRQKAIFNVGRVALLINVFSTQDFSKFQKASEDSLALPHIAGKFPYIKGVCQAALAAGASGACAAGYGPSVLALLPGRTGDALAQSASNQLEQDVAKAMLKAAEEKSISGQILIAKPCDVGAHVVAQKSALGPADEQSRISYYQ